MKFSMPCNKFTQIMHSKLVQTSMGCVGVSKEEVVNLVVN